MLSFPSLLGACPFGSPKPCSHFYEVGPQYVWKVIFHGQSQLNRKEQGPNVSKSQKEKWRLKFHLKQNYRSAECVFITKMHHCLFVLLWNKQGVKKIVETMLRPSSLWEVTNELKPPGDGLVLRQSSPWVQRQNLRGFSTGNRCTPRRHLSWGRGRTATQGERSNQRQRRPVKFQVTKGTAQRRCQGDQKERKHCQGSNEEGQWGWQDSECPSARGRGSQAWDIWIHVCECMCVFLHNAKVIAHRLAGNLSEQICWPQLPKSGQHTPRLVPSDSGWPNPQDTWTTLSIERMECLAGIILLLWPGCLLRILLHAFPFQLSEESQHLVPASDPHRAFKAAWTTTLSKLLPPPPPHTHTYLWVRCLSSFKHHSLGKCLGVFQREGTFCFCVSLWHISSMRRITPLAEDMCYLYHSINYYQDFPSHYEQRAVNCPIRRTEFKKSETLLTLPQPHCI